MKQILLLLVFLSCYSTYAMNKSKEEKKQKSNKISRPKKNGSRKSVFRLSFLKKEVKQDWTRFSMGDDTAYTPNDKTGKEELHDQK